MSGFELWLLLHISDIKLGCMFVGFSFIVSGFTSLLASSEIKIYVRNVLFLVGFLFFAIGFFLIPTSFVK